MQLLFSESITPTSKVITGTAAGWLGDKSKTAAGNVGSCTSPNGTAAGVTGSVGSVYPAPGAGGSGVGTGPQSCTSSNLPNGVGEITWQNTDNTSSYTSFDWQFGVTASGATFTGQITSSTAVWASVGDRFVVELTKFTQNGGSGTGLVPIVSCFMPGGVSQDDITGIFQLYTPVAGPLPSIAVSPGPCTVSGSHVSWTDTVTGTNFPPSSSVVLRDTGFITGSGSGNATVISFGMSSTSVTVVTDSSGNFTANIFVTVDVGGTQPQGTIEQNADFVAAVSTAGIAANNGGPNYCVA
ncbi:hypothetical protein GCM10022267_91570 [Lentzea roselyniae]|uniref:Uncharacterized protein n=1 Tax=Lentzea roselyniae TaxID=531940 RepID=A0ABP7CI37_9PSEU